MAPLSPLHRSPATTIPAAPRGAAASWQSHIVNGLLNLFVRRPLARRSLEELPAMRARLDRMGSRIPVAANVLREQDRLGPVPAEWTRIAGVSDRRRTLLYLHGGAFLMGSPRMYRGLTADLARALHAEVVAIDYRLAPEHPYPAALQDAEQAYRHLLTRGQAAQRIFVCGDSAGGNLALALLQRVRNAGLPMPAGTAVFSPWLDLSADYDETAVRAARDPMLPAARIREAAGLYHGANDPKDPLVSPIGLDFAGLSPILIQAGERELLLPALRVFALRAQQDGANLVLRTWPNMPHVFQAFARALPEGSAALAELAVFANECLQRETAKPAATALHAPVQGPAVTALRAEAKATERRSVRSTERRA